MSTREIIRLFAGMALGCQICLFVAGCGSRSASGGGGGGGGGGTNPPPNMTVWGAFPFGVTPIGNTWLLAGAGDFTLIVGGSGFPKTAVIEWNGVQLPTIGDSTDLNAPVSGSRVAAPATITITVYDPASGARSNSVLFGVASPAAATAGVV